MNLYKYILTRIQYFWSSASTYILLRFSHRDTIPTDNILAVSVQLYVRMYLRITFLVVGTVPTNNANQSKKWLLMQTFYRSTCPKKWNVINSGWKLYIYNTWVQGRQISATSNNSNYKQKSNNYTFYIIG